MLEDKTNQTKPGRLRLSLLAGTGLILIILCASTITRLAAKEDVEKWTKEQAVPSVSILAPKAGSAGNLILPARLQAWAEAPVYARTNGYLKSWNADIGTHVTKDQLLAEIDTPEIDHQLTAARAALTKIQAEQKLAQANASRSEKLVKIDAVSKQDNDEKLSALASLNAQSSEAQAEIERLQTLTNFKQVIAPFDGVITSRATDIGNLINESSSAAPLFTVSDISKLRLYVNVPEKYASEMKDGLTASFTIPEMPEHEFKAQLYKTSEAIDRSSGTMLVQLIVENSSEALKPGAYAQLHFDLKDNQAALRIPASALIFRKDGTSLAVMDQNNKAIIKPIHIGRDFGAELEVADGLDANDKVIDSPPDSLATGDAVKPLETKAPAK